MPGNLVPGSVNFRTYARGVQGEGAGGLWVVHTLQMEGVGPEPRFTGAFGGSLGAVGGSKGGP